MKFKNAYSIEDLRQIARTRMPDVAFQYLESGTDHEHVIEKNQNQFRSMEFIPSFCLPTKKPDLKIKLFGYEYDSPIGMAPIGLTGLIWPGSEKKLALTADKFNTPFCLSTVSTSCPEEIGRLSIKNQIKWFQLYPPKDQHILDSLLTRIDVEGFETLVVTVDIPAPSIRERSKRHGVTVPLKFSWKLIIDVIRHPQWFLATILNGFPRLKTVENYANNNSLRFVNEFVGNRLGGVVDWEYIENIRAKWKGNLIIKGLMNPEDGLKARKLGVDCVYVSNHGGRQFDANPGTLNVLPKFRELLGDDFPLIVDGGFRSGLDILKGLNCGADMVFLGRPFLYGLGANYDKGSARAHEILVDQLSSAMMQLSIKNIAELRSLKRYES